MTIKKDLFTDEEKKAIVKTIGEAEDMTSGEIRLHIEPKCEKDPVDRAIEVFNKLGMQKTAAANGVLIYVAYTDHKLAIIGDSGINAVVPGAFWEGVKDVMIAHFKQEEFYQGITFAITETGKHLKQYFPLKDDDKNELPDEISEG